MPINRSSKLNESYDAIYKIELHELGLQNCCGKYFAWRDICCAPNRDIFAYLSYQQDILTLDRVSQIFLVCLAEGGGFGVLIWFILTKPTMNRNLAIAALNQIENEKNN